MELAVNTKFKEERLHHSIAFNLRVRGLPKSQDPQKANLDFLHNTLDLKNIKVEKAWIVQDESLIIRFDSVVDRLQALRVKKLLSLPNKIYLDVDLTCLQVDDLRKARTLVATTRKDSTWTII